MEPAPTPLDEQLRLATLRSLSILDTLPEDRFDRLTRLARRLFDVPIALVSLVDANRQWFKSSNGVLVRETPRAISFCGHAICQEELLLIPDTDLDPRFHDNPLVTGPPHVRFYAGHPLVAENGCRLGTLCLMDTRPRTLEFDDCLLFADLALMAEQELIAMQRSTIDDLTTLSNRRGFSLLGEHVLALCTDLHRPAILMFFDMDGLKPVNDCFGHAEGDRALSAFSTALKAAFHQSDVVARIGGDEFATLLANADQSMCKLSLSRLQQYLVAWNSKNKLGYELRYSVGSVAFDFEHPTTIEAMLAEADAIMYAHKARRRRDGPSSTPES